jgi:hypothetical protein
VNQEYLDEQVPEISVLRLAVFNVKKFDFAMLHNEFQGFLKLKEEILRKFPSNVSYREVLAKYCELIESF